MKPHRTMKRIALLAVQTSVAAVIAVGCGQNSDAPKPAAETAPVRGEPIAAPVTVKVESTNAADAEAKPAVSVSPLTTEKAASAAAAGLIPDKPLGTQVAMEAPTNVEEGYTAVGFDRLSGYSFELSDDLLLAPPEKLAEAGQRTNAQIPEKVRSLNDTKVAIKGFMMPLKVDDGLVTEFLILRDQSMCCYGSVPKINEWVSVKMTGKGLRPMMDQAVTLYGKLHVGEMRENGYLVGIYQLDGEKMAGPQDL
jgi:hypothetical protein